MRQYNLVKFFTGALLLVVSIHVNAQYTINGYSCVVPDFTLYGYTVTGGSSGYNDKWCITGGVVSGTSNSCMVNNGYGNTTVYITWNAGVTSGTVSYYANNTNPNPSVTLNVTIVNNTISSVMGPYLFTSLNKPTEVKLTGSDANVCSPNYLYYWQRSIDNVNFTNMDNANQKDYLNLEAFSQTVYFRRMIVVAGVPHISTALPVMPYTALNAGVLSPHISTIKSGTAGPTITASSASGGSMCGPSAYSYQWETSTDNVNWTVQSTSSSNFSPGTINQKTYIRQKVICGPLTDISNVAVINIYKTLEPGTIAPDNKIIPVNSDPGSFTGNPARYGNPGAYAYQWQSSTTGDFSSNVTDISGTNSLSYNPGSSGSTGIMYYRRKITCDGVTAYSNIVSIVTGTPTTNQSYIRTRTIIKPFITTKQSADLLSSTQDVLQSVQYFDALGRGVQTVIKQGSLNSAAGHTTPYDLVQPAGYDNRGRDAVQYLPYASSSATDGLFKTNVFGEQNSFNTNLFSGENYYFKLTNFETSPDSRPTDVMTAGLDWVGSNAGIGTIYSANILADNVRVWNVYENGAGQLSSYGTTSIYLDGKLYKSITFNETGKQIIEFKDEDDLVILKKVQLTGEADEGAGSNYTGWLCTYYLYDDHKNLRAVIQPEGVRYLAQNNWSLAGTDGSNVLEGQFFRYEYDQRNRMTMKKIPGAGTTYMVYDYRDRMIMIQDANLRALSGQEKWLVTLYDEINRQTFTGLVLNSSISNPQRSFTDHTTLANASITYPFTNPPGSGWELLTETHYDDYVGVSGSLAGTFDNSWASYFSAQPGFLPYPRSQTATTALKGITSYTKVSVLGIPGTYLYRVNIYDDYGNIIQVKSSNIAMGTDVATTQYSFSGSVLTTVSKQLIASIGPSQTTTTVTNLFYDILGRISKTEKRVSLSSIASPNNGMSAAKIINEFTYNALGQVQNKNLGRKLVNGVLSQNDPIAKIAYEYNIQGWLLHINKNYIINGTNDDRYFALNLGYNKLVEAPSNAPMFPMATYKNGNIQGMIWRSAGDDVNRRYNFFYDNANRILLASFAQQKGTNWNTDDGINFTMQLGFGPGGPPGVDNGYDYNGNILKMVQWGVEGAASSQIDVLTYTYLPRSNKLQNVRDIENDKDSKLGDFKTLLSHPQSGPKPGATDLTTITDYEYDANGNMIKDYNKGIGAPAAAGITYNFLNLPQTVNFPTKGGIDFVYDATGKKLKKTVTEGSTVTETYYFGEFVFEKKNNGLPTLLHISHEEGRIRTLFDPVVPTTPIGFANDYFLKDHLGNVRMVLTDEFKQNQYPAATLEGNAAPGALSMINHEKQFYTINDTYKISKGTAGITPSTDYYNHNGDPPPNNSYPPSTTPNSAAVSDYLYELNANRNKTGLGIVIKVMAGDKIDIHGKSFYTGSTTYSNSNSSLMLIGDLIGSFFGAPDNSGVALKGISSGTMESLNSGAIPSNFFRALNGETTTIPKAYINFLFFDEQFKYAGGGGASRVGTSGVVKDHWLADQVLQAIPVPKNGYLYVYVSNESNANVYFDNLQVFHTRGPIIEETHYYPFGLTMAGISSKAMNFGSPENKYRFNKGSELQNKEFSDGSGLDWYATNLRSLDPQLGRWWQIDSKPDQAQSLYSAMGNNPILYTDLLGDTIKSNVTYEYTRTAKPTKRSDLGNTTDTYVSITDATASNVNITIDITISLSAAFQGTTKATNIETQNPGLEREVIAHEEGHKDQLMDAANQPVTVTIDINGKATPFTGTADVVIVNATAAFNRSTEASGMTREEKSNFVTNSIATPALTAMNTNIDNALKPSAALETDANNRAATALGANTIKYNNGSTPIIFNGKKFKN